MKKKDLAQKVDDLSTLLADSPSLRLAKDRYEQGERLLAQARRLLEQAEATCTELDRKTRQAEQNFDIDPATTRRALRAIAAMLGVEETTPGLFLGGHEAIIQRVQVLLDTADKANLLTAFYNSHAVGDIAGLSVVASADEVRNAFTLLTRTTSIPPHIRDRLNVAISESRSAPPGKK